MKRIVIVIAAVIILASPIPAAGIDVDLDPTFSGDGVALGGSDTGATAVESAGGDVYIAGLDSSQNPTGLFVTKFDAAGVVDVSFGEAGTRALSVDTRLGPALVRMTITDDGQIVVTTQGRTKVIVVRLTEAGDLDPAFSGDGLRYLPGEGSGIYLPPDVAVDTEGRTIVGAMVSTTSGADVKVWRLLRDGTIDQAWSNGGVRTINESKDGDDWIDTLTVDARNRVLVGSDTAGSAAHVFRFRVNGSLDASFSDDGLATFRLARKEWSFPVGLSVGTSGQITVATAGFNNNLYGSARLTADGELDRSYGDGGVVTLRCRTRCGPIWGDAEGGQSALILDYFQPDDDGRYRVARIGRDGTEVRVMSIDPLPGSDKESLWAIDIAKSNTLIAGSGTQRAFVARIP